MSSISIQAGGLVDPRTRYQVTDLEGNLYLRTNLSASFMMFKPNRMDSFTFFRYASPSDPMLYTAMDVTVSTQGAIPPQISNAMQWGDEAVLVTSYPH